MSDRRVYLLDTRETRQGVAKIVAELPAMSRVEIKGPKRTLDQNALMWVWLTAFAEQAEWAGKRRTTGEWKDLLTGAVKIAGGGVEAVPGLEGGIMLLGLHTSDLSVAEMADLITYMEAKATELGVTLPEIDRPDDKLSTAARDTAAGDSPVVAR
jgi:hypothetical protein